MGRMLRTEREKREKGTERGRERGREGGREREGQRERVCVLRYCKGVQ